MKDIVLPFAQEDVLNKINSIINYVGNSTSIGESKQVDLDYDLVQFFCKSKMEFYTILEYAKQQGLLKLLLPIYPINPAKSPAETEPHVAGLELTFDGWQRFEMNQKINVKSKSAFVAMSFDKDLDDIFFQAIAEACKECGFIPNRVDKSEHNEKICDKIIGEIKQSKFVIAEFTRQKHGVYFEAGYAYGLGLPVIWCCREDDKDKLHFDTRQYNHIIWTTLDEFKEKLVNRINATIVRN